MAARRVGLGVVAALLVAVTGVVTWMDLSRYSLGECMNDEKDDWPRLEAVATTVMSDVGDRYSRVSLCEDAGPPGHTSLRVSVYEWTSRAEARDFLRAAGMVSEQGTSVLDTSEGTVHVGYPTVEDHLENDGQKFVQVWFSLA